MSNPNDITGRVVAEEITIDRSAWVDTGVDYFPKGSTMALRPAEARQFGAAIGWKVFDDRAVASLLRADDTLDFADTTALTADHF